MSSKFGGFQMGGYVPPSLDTSKTESESTYIKKDGLSESKKANTLTLGDYLT